MIKVVFHIDEMEKWPITIANAKNLHFATEEEKEIIILANGLAVNYYITEDEKDQTILKKLVEKKIVLTACANALKAHAVPQEQLPKYIKVVPAGVLELVQKQHQGYAYIKP